MKSSISFFYIKLIVRSHILLSHNIWSNIESFIKTFTSMKLSLQVCSSITICLDFFIFSLLFQGIYEKLPVADKITFLVTALRSADNAIEVRLKANGYATTFMCHF